MKLIVAVLLASAMAAFAPSASFAVDNTISASCRPGAPASYSRPAAYCDIIASNKSLAPTGSTTVPQDEEDAE